VQNHEAAERHNTQEVLRMVCMAHQHAPDVVQPGESPFPVQRRVYRRSGRPSWVLGARAVHAVRCHQRDLSDGQDAVSRVALVCLIADHPGGGRGGNGRSASRGDTGAFRRRSRRRGDGARKTRAVCRRPALRPVTPRGRAHSWAPDLATTNVPSMKHALRSRAPQSRRSTARASSTLCRVPSRPPGWKRRGQVG
jgi:hypothetical protein